MAKPRFPVCHPSDSRTTRVIGGPAPPVPDRAPTSYGFALGKEAPDHRELSEMRGVRQGTPAARTPSVAGSAPYRGDRNRPTPDVSTPIASKMPAYGTFSDLSAPGRAHRSMVVAVGAAGIRLHAPEDPIARPEGRDDRRKGVTNVPRTDVSAVLGSCLVQRNSGAKRSKVRSTRPGRRRTPPTSEDGRAATPIVVAHGVDGQVDGQKGESARPYFRFSRMNVR